HPLNDQVQLTKPLKFRTKFGASLECGLDGNHLILNFPLNKPVKLDASQHRWLDDLTREVLDTSAATLVEAHWSAGTKKLLLRLKGADDQLVLTRAKPDFARLLQIETGGMVRGMIITQKADLHR